MVEFFGVIFSLSKQKPNLSVVYFYRRESSIIIFDYYGRGVVNIMEVLFNLVYHFSR